jgi:hypothetical protein
VLRFVVLEIPEYTFKEFKEIVADRSKEENVDDMTVIDIATIYKMIGSNYWI